MRPTSALVCATFVVSVGCVLTVLAEAAGQAFAPPAAPAAPTSAQARPAEKAVSQTGAVLKDLRQHAPGLETGVPAWLWLIISLVVGLLLGTLAASLLRRFGRRLAARGWQARALLVRDSAGPLALALLTLGLAVGLAGLIVDFDPQVRGFWLKALLLLCAIAVFWYAYNLIGVVDVVFARWISRRETALDQQIAPLARKTLRVLLVMVGLLFVADAVFGQNIGAWLAGLGIAGLAVSLAAQDSLKNLFGSITILWDRPFRIGEEIRYAGYEGVIEEIGFRSTKIRTASGSLVNIPNANIVNSPVDNVSRRPFIRRSMNLLIPHNTPAAKMNQALDLVRAILADEEIRAPIQRQQDMPPRAYFSEFNPEGLSLVVIYWYSPAAYWDYIMHAQKVNLRICEEFAKAGIELVRLQPLP